MTQPEIEPEDETLAYEVAAVAAVVGPVSAALATALAPALTALTASSALTVAEGVAIGRALARRLRRLAWTPMRPALDTRARGATALGVRLALDALDTPRPRTVRPRPPDTLPDLDATVRTALDSAARIADTAPVRSRTALDRVSGRARSGVSDAAGATRYVINDRINGGTADVARAAGLRTMWVAERNACLHCLAYAGWVTEPDSEFPPGLTFDAAPLRPFGPLLWPPLHPNCRCRILPTSERAGPPPESRSAVSPAGRAYAEARRSVVYQWTDYASGVAARRAAARLLDQGAGLADSVERRARAALRRGDVVRRPR